MQCLSEKIKTLCRHSLNFYPGDESDPAERRGKRSLIVGKEES